MKPGLFSLTFCLVLGFQINLNAQIINSDSIFHVARQKADSGFYDQSIDILKKLKAEFPQNKDFSIYLSRVLYWNNRTEEARTEILNNWSEASPIQEVLDVLILVEYKLNYFDEVIKRCNFGIGYFEFKDFYFLYKAYAFESQSKDEEALAALKEIKNSILYAKQAAYLETKILRKQNNIISAGHLIVSIDEINNSVMRFSHIEYVRKFKKFSLVPRVNHASTQMSTSYQFEFDAYWNLTSKSYIYSNMGISERNSLFPRTRFGAEVYTENKSISYSGGIRILHFQIQQVIYMATGHFAIYMDEVSINFRPFIVFDNTEVLPNYVIYFRKTDESKETHVQLDVQYGALPYYFLTADVITRLSAVRVGASAKIRVGKNYFIQPAFMYELEEIFPENFRNRYNLQLILSKRF